MLVFKILFEKEPHFISSGQNNRGWNDRDQNRGGRDGNWQGNRGGNWNQQDNR